MKTILRPNLLKFAIYSAVLTILFRLGLSLSISYDMAVLKIISVLTYAIFMWYNGRYFGKKESEFLMLYDLGFKLHFTAFIAHNIFSILWFVLGFKSQGEDIETIYEIAIIWSVILLVHLVYFFYARRSFQRKKFDLFK